MTLSTEQRTFPHPFYLLMVEDSLVDFHQLVRHLRREWPDLIARRVETSEEMTAAIQERPWDAVVADVLLPSFGAKQALAIHKELCGNIPFIAISGVINEEEAVGLLKAGAHDFVTKANVSRLIPAIDREYWDAQERMQRQQAEEALRENGEQFYAIAQSAREAIISANGNGEIIFWNPGAATVFGYEEEEILGRPLTLLIPERYRQAHMDGLEHVIKAGSTRLTEKRIELAAIKKDGTEFPMEISLSTWTARKARFFSAIIHDITERQQNQRTMAALMEAAHAANQAKSEFLSHMSHEIRTPMNVILGMSDLLSEMELPEDGAPYVKVLKQASEGLLQLINDILDLSKIEAGELVLRDEPFDLPELLAGAMAIIEAQARGKGLTLTLRMDHGLRKVVLGDCHRLRQVLLNLLNNAIKFTEQGEVTLAASADAGDDLHFMVIDQGIGIAPEKLDLVFQPFKQADLSTARLYGGTGLGLAICRRLVEGMDGRIWLESKAGEGSAFHVTLPLPEVDAAVDETLETEVFEDTPIDGSASCSLTRGMDILLAEDSADNALLFHAFLKGTPYRLTLAENGLKAVEKIQSGHFDLILMDMQMPVMDGYEATREIRAWESRLGRPHLPIVALTANAMREDAALSLAVGCDLHLCKPILKGHLLGILKRFAAHLPRAK